jgi:hypothetical protein
LLLNLSILLFEPLLALFELHLDLFLGQSKVIFELLLPLLPLDHLISFDEHNICKLWVNDSILLLVLLLLRLHFARFGLELVLLVLQIVLTNIPDHKTAVLACSE